MDPTTNSITLPHHPTYGLELADETITMLVQESVPMVKGSLQISRLPEGMSYNNKIYKIDISDDGTGSSQSFVLKVNGRFFGPAKIENEVSCLLLLRHFCPELPIPTVVAWSTDGSHVTQYHAAQGHSKPTANHNLQEQNLPGWILMSGLPGMSLDAYALSREEQSSMAVQVATILLTWRRKMPRSISCANLHFHAQSRETARLSLYHPRGAPGLAFHVYGFIGYGNDFCPPVTSLKEYWKTELEWQISKLTSKDVHAPNRETLLSKLQNFVHKILPELPLFQDKDADDPSFVFTHADFFPRNILVQGDPPKITGIVDFEFAGFSPPMEEFAQEWQPPTEDDPDWPLGMCDAILSEMEKQGEATPRTLQHDEKLQIQNLVFLREYIAPWWLENVEEGADTPKELEEARSRVERAVAVLSGVATGESKHFSVQ